MGFSLRSSLIASITVFIFGTSGCVSSQTESSRELAKADSSPSKRPIGLPEGMGPPAGLKPNEPDKPWPEGCFYLGVSESGGSDFSEQKALPASGKLLVSKAGLFADCYDDLKLKTETYEVIFDWRANPQGQLVWIHPMSVTENAKELERCLFHSLVSFPLDVAGGSGQIKFVGGPIYENQCPVRENLHRWQPGKNMLFRHRIRVLR